MLLHDEKWKSCKSCKRHTTIIRQRVYACDRCKTEIDLNDKTRRYLDFTVFYNSTGATSHQLCSWKCAAKWLPTVKTDNFISMPFLTFDANGEYGQKLTQEFLKLIGKATP